MIKVICFQIDKILFDADSDKRLKKQKMFEYSNDTNFIASIGKENVMTISHLNLDSYHSACAIFYNDDELLTCPSCTREISNGFKFCPECGVKLK